MIRGALAVAAVSLTLAAAARADGDPASDVLLLRNVYFPHRPPSPAVRADLQQAADAAYARGDRVRVALVVGVEDLGAIPSMFGRPGEYARFLGVELGLWYVGPLLVVMPAGFGYYDGDRPTVVAQQILGSIEITGGTPDDLARSATRALRRLASGGVLRSPDVVAPLVTAHPAFAKLGKVVTLRFDLYDDSGRSRAVVRVYGERSLLATLDSPAGFGIGTRAVSVRWRVPATLRSRQLRYCVLASDPAGNRSKATCAPFLRLSR